MSNLTAFFLVSLTILCLAVVADIFIVRRNRVIRDISQLVGNHLGNLRASAAVGGAMPLQLLQQAMNRDIHPTDETKASEDIEFLFSVLQESKRRSFQMPLVHRDMAAKIMRWSQTARNPDIASKAAALMAVAVEKHANHIDQVIAQSMVKICDQDPVKAARDMKSLDQLLDGVLASGITMSGNMALLSPNDAVVQQWAASSDVAAKSAAESLLKTVAAIRAMS